MNNHLGLNFLNTLLAGVVQGAQTEEDLVIKTTSEIRMADPKGISLSLEMGSANESPETMPIAGTRVLYGANSDVTEGVQPAEVDEGVKLPDAIVTSLPSRPRGDNSRVEASTRQIQAYAPVEAESPELVPSTPSTVIDYNPEYQNQFDHYLRTRAFDRMFGPSLKGVGAPEPRTPAY